MGTPRIAPEVKEQILNRIKNEGVTAKQAAAEHGISDTTVYNWLAGSVTQNPTMTELLKVKREKEELLLLVGELTLKLSQAQKKK